MNHEIHTAPAIFHPDAPFSADDLASVIRTAGPETQADWFLKCLSEAYEMSRATWTPRIDERRAKSLGIPKATARSLLTHPHKNVHFDISSRGIYGPSYSPEIEKLGLSRILHTLGSAVQKLCDEKGRSAGVGKLLAIVYSRLSQAEKYWLESLEIPSGPAGPKEEEAARAAAERRKAAGKVIPANRTTKAAQSAPVRAWKPARALAWAHASRDAAFENISRTIVFDRARSYAPPKNALRSDEIIWGRAPARLDLGGGWTDTPPYSLEHGGCVINAAVNLNGQPPIQVYARVIREPEIRIYSIDHGTQVTIRTMDELLDYRLPTSQFGLAKATLALCGFAGETGSGQEERNAESTPGSAPHPASRPAVRKSSRGGPAGPRPAEQQGSSGASNLRNILNNFGGGIELSTLAAIPSGSGLGTSSIMGGVLMAVVHRLIGREVSQRELFHYVLQLEQELTTGGGWQDQVGGLLPGVKMIRTEPGLVPDPLIHYVTEDLLNHGGGAGGYLERQNAARYAGAYVAAGSRGAGDLCNRRDPYYYTDECQPLLYYTGIRRLAKNILRTVVGNYLDREAAAMTTLKELHAFPPKMSEAMARKDMREFGKLIDLAWRLNKRIDPDSTTQVIEGILGKIKKNIWGAKLLGAGGGGFLLIVCKSGKDAARVRRALMAEPPNDRARFFDYGVSHEGLSVTVC